MGIVRISSFAFPNLFLLLILNYSLSEIEHFIHLNEKENLLGQTFFYNLLMINIYIYIYIAISLKNNGGGGQGFFSK
jgi:hypothetical protein